MLVWRSFYRDALWPNLQKNWYSFAWSFTYLHDFPPARAPVALINMPRPDRWQTGSHPEITVVWEESSILADWVSGYTGTRDSHASSPADQGGGSPLQMSAKGHSLPSHSMPVPTNVRYASNRWVIGRQLVDN